MKLYWILLLSLTYFCLLFGFILPMLFSEASTESVICGIGLLTIVTPIVGILFYRTAVKVLKIRANKNSEGR